MEIKENIKALIIDDSPYMHALMNALLKKEGISHIFHAHNGDDGLQMFFQIEPDIIFLDNIMPKTSGMEVLEELRKSNHDCKVIMMSSMASVKAIEDSKNFGVNYYLVKPFLPEKIRYIINRFLTSDNLVRLAI
jgi:two-component system, chemotaxis family, chemotaxis protein CheY